MELNLLPVETSVIGNTVKQKCMRLFTQIFIYLVLRDCLPEEAVALTFRIGSTLVALFEKVMDARTI